MGAELPTIKVSVELTGILRCHNIATDKQPQAMLPSNKSWEHQHGLEWTEWHLTPSGWEQGDEKTDFNKTSRPIPAGRVQTVTYHEEVSSGFSPLEKFKTVDWTSADTELLKALIHRFGEAPEHL